MGHSFWINYILFKTLAKFPIEGGLQKCCKLEANFYVRWMAVLNEPIRQRGLTCLNECIPSQVFQLLPHSHWQQLRLSSTHRLCFVPFRIPLSSYVVIIYYQISDINHIYKIFIYIYIYVCIPTILCPTFLSKLYRISSDKIPSVNITMEKLILVYLKAEGATALLLPYHRMTSTGNIL